MKQNSSRPLERVVGLFMWVFLLVLPRPGFAIDTDGNCDIGNISGDCTISTQHAASSNLTIEGNLTITSTGHLMFTGADPRQLYVKGSLDIQVDGAAKGKISYEGSGTANPGHNGGTLTIIVDGNVTVSGGVSVKGGNGSNVGGATGATGGNGGILTFNVCGNFTSSGEITARGGNGGNSTGPSATSGGNGGNGGTITVNVNGLVTINGIVHAQGGNGGNPQGTGQNGANGTITINTEQAAANTVGANFNPTPTISLNLEDPAQCSQPVPEGCGLGFWKNHGPAWAATGYLTTDTVGDVFNSAPVSLAGSSLLDALSFKGGSTLDGAKQILLRQAVAALLNAAHPDVNYPRSEPDVIAAANTQLASSTRSAILTLAGQLDSDNNLGCPLN